MTTEGDFYTPQEAERILSRTIEKPLTERRIRQMLQAAELEGFKDEAGRWHVAQRDIHRLLEDRRESSPEAVLEGSERATELMERVEGLQRELGRLEGRLELSAVAESTIREERDRLLAQVEEERRRADVERERAEQFRDELDRARRPWWRRMLGG